MDCVAPPQKKGGQRNPSVTSRCGSPLLLLTCALLMTSSHSEGPLALVKEGDDIVINLDDRTLSVDITDEEMASPSILAAYTA